MRPFKLDSFPAIALLSLLALACQRSPAPPSDAAHGAPEAESWALTAWGERYEIFAEMDPLAAGTPVASHTHVTVLDTFSPLREGVVSILLRGADGSEQAFRQDRAVRDGIFSIEVRAGRPDTVDLVFRVESRSGIEEIPGGRVLVGSARDPGRVIESPRATALPPGASTAASAPAASADPVSFLKEQQWRTEFGTEWAMPSRFDRAVRGPALVRPAAGGEVVLASPLDGVVSPRSGPFVGLEIRRGDPVVEVVSRVGSDRSAAAVRAEMDLARARLTRLEELLALEAVSHAEVEEARARVLTLEAESGSLEGRESRGASVRAPFTGRVAAVLATPGEGVSAGQSLVRLVRESPVWVEVALSPGEVRSVVPPLAGLVLYLPAERSPLALSADEVRVVSRSPEVSRTTGTVTVILEVEGGASLRPGTVLEAEILLPDRVEGIVVPPSAVVDDGGVPVVYVHTGGESFARREVRVLSRQGNKALVEGVPAGERIVTVGGAAIRRAALLRSGPVEGHVH
jgi:RND family efflux transporter MFP subunit